MSNNKQSSVEWFSKESWNLKVKLENKEISIGEYGVTYVDLLQQAKAMHKEEHAKTWDDAMENMKARGGNDMRAWADFDDYFNNKYKK